MKAWIKGGLIGGILFLFIILTTWIQMSINMNCILEPAQLINVGGADCYFKDYFSIWSILIFLIPMIIGFLLGSLSGIIFEKISQSKIPKSIKLGLLGIILGFIFWIILENIFNTKNYSSFLLLLSIFLGALIGFVVGKIKEKTQN